MTNFLQRFLGHGSPDVQANVANMRDKLNGMFDVPVDLANPLLDYMLERTYLEDVSDRDTFNVVEMPVDDYIGWLRIDRLPVSPLRIDDYDLLSRWQGVLSSLHAWKQKLIFLLQRRDGETHLYVGVQGIHTDAEIKKCRCALCSSMPGIDIHYLDGKTCENDMREALAVNNQIQNSLCGGAITGIPSFRRNTQYGVLQTLDKLAFGFKNTNGSDANYSLIIVAEPLGDRECSDIISRYQKLGSDIHTLVTQHITESVGQSHSEGTFTSVNAGLGFGLGQGNLSPLTDLVTTALFTANPAALAAKNTVKLFMQAMGIQGNVGFSRGLSTSNSVNYNRSVAKDYLNKFAQYSERLTDKHCERLRSGRDIGFWNAGVYVLADTVDNVNLVTGMLRSVYSGDYTHVEPIRTHLFKATTALRNIKNFNLIPIVVPEANEYLKNNMQWHTLGNAFEYVSTPVNTEELSLFTSLPRKDVPGIRFVKNAARFASNPGKTTDKNDLVKIGNIVDTGIMQSNAYTIPINSLVRHSLIAGSTGCGKTTTCKTIINAVMQKNKPLLIIEPAKDEWVRWAIKHNEAIDSLNISVEEKEQRKILIFEPGLTSFEGTLLSSLRLNPFQPASIKGAPIDMQTRCEHFTALMNASLPTSDILPVIMDEALYSYLSEKVDDFEESEMEVLEKYPMLEGALPVAKRILTNRGYEKRVTDSFIAALETRFKYLTRGKRGKILNEPISTSYDVLFGRNCVINLSKIPSDKDKALIMSMLLLALHEYRESAYTYDAKYRRHAQNNELMHLTVIEEAHNVLTRPTGTLEGTGNPQMVVANLFSKIISEVRSWGEGLMIIDQVPTRLIPDVIKNTNYKICHRMTAPDDCAVMAQSLALRDDQKGIIPTLEQGYAIISGDLDDAASWVKITKPTINL